MAFSLELTGLNTRAFRHIACMFFHGTGKHWNQTSWTKTIHKRPHLWLGLAGTKDTTPWLKLTVAEATPPLLKRCKLHLSPMGMTDTEGTHLSLGLTKSYASIAGKASFSSGWLTCMESTHPLGWVQGCAAWAMKGRCGCRILGWPLDQLIIKLFGKLVKLFFFFKPVRLPEESFLIADWKVNPKTGTHTGPPSLTPALQQLTDTEATPPLQGLTGTKALLYVLYSDAISFMNNTFI